MKIQVIKKIALFLLLIISALLIFLTGCELENGDDFSLPRDKYLGQWICQDADYTTYSATIASDPSNSVQVIIYNFFNISPNGIVTAIVTDESITVDNQKIQNVPGTFWCEGYGTLVEKGGKTTIQWSKYAMNSEKTTSVYTKQ